MIVFVLGGIEFEMWGTILPNKKVQTNDECQTIDDWYSVKLEHQWSFVSSRGGLTDCYRIIFKACITVWGIP